MTYKANRFMAPMAGCAWMGSGYLIPEEHSYGGEEDFDALLAASSFGSEQALAIIGQTPGPACEHARRIVDGEEKRTPPEGDIDDAVGGLVYGLARGVVPGHATPPGDGSAPAADDALATLAGRGPAHSTWMALAACHSSSVLWPDHRAALLQALIDHDAFTGLRPDVAWKIIDWTFDLERPPQVLRQCAALAVDQIDISPLAYTWLTRWDGNGTIYSRRALDYFSRGHARALPEGSVRQKVLPGPSGSPEPAVTCVRVREVSAPADAPAIPAGPVHRTILAVDVERPAQRFDQARTELRRHLYDLLDQALEAAGITGKHLQPPGNRGDGILMLIRPYEDAPESVFLNRLPPVLTGLLTEHNSLPAVPELRLRAVVHTGDVRHTGADILGEDIEVAFRMLNTPLLKKALRQTGISPLAMVISGELITETGQPGLMAASPAGPLIRVRVAGRHRSGRIHVPVPLYFGHLEAAHRPEHRKPPVRTVPGVPRWLRAAAGHLAAAGARPEIIKPAATGCPGAKALAVRQEQAGSRERRRWPSVSAGIVIAVLGIPAAELLHSLGRAIMISAVGVVGSGMMLTALSATLLRDPARERASRMLRRVGNRPESPGPASDRAGKPAARTRQAQ